MQAILLVGGFGTRLKHIVSDVPKPMAPIAGRPFLAYLFDYLIGHGVDEVVLSVHHMPEKISDYFGDHYQGIPVHYALEEAPLGTGGAIRYAMEKLQPSQPILALNGDSLVMLDHAAMYQQHLANNAGLTLALRHVPDRSRYGTVVVEDGIITEFTAAGSPEAGLINAGVYVLNPDIFEGYDLPQSFSIEHDFFGKHTAALQAQYVPVADYFIDIGVPDDYARAQVELPRKLTPSPL